jgi:hypothetical protein
LLGRHPGTGELDAVLIEQASCFLGIRFGGFIPALAQSSISSCSMSSRNDRMAPAHRAAVQAAD